MIWYDKKKLVVAFDFSDECKEAVRVALKIANSHDDVHIVHAIPQLPVNDPYVIWDSKTDEKRRAHSRSSIDQSLSDLPNEGFHVHTEVGDAAEMIVDMAEEVDAGMIIIPSHGRTGFKRLLLGSVAERVVRMAPLPVLVLKRERD